MSKLSSGSIQGFQVRHIESLEKWIEIAVFHEEALYDLLREFSLDGKELSEYKQYVVETWPGIPSELRGRLGETAVVNEIYQEIVNLNPALHPKNVWSAEAVTPATRPASATLPDKEAISIMASFRGRDKSSIVVIQGGLSVET